MKNWRYAIQNFVFGGKTASATHFHGFLPIKWKSAIIATFFLHTWKTLFMASDPTLSLFLYSQITWWCLYIAMSKPNTMQPKNIYQCRHIERLKSRNAFLAMFLTPQYELEVSKWPPVDQRPWDNGTIHCQPVLACGKLDLKREMKWTFQQVEPERLSQCNEQWRNYRPPKKFFSRLKLSFWGSSLAAREERMGRFVEKKTEPLKKGQLRNQRRKVELR